MTRKNNKETTEGKCKSISIHLIPMRYILTDVYISVQRTIPCMYTDRFSYHWQQKTTKKLQRGHVNTQWILIPIYQVSVFLNFLTMFSKQSPIASKRFKIYQDTSLLILGSFLLFSELKTPIAAIYRSYKTT